MARIRNQANSSTLFQFDDTTKVILNVESLKEESEIETTRQKRYGQLDIVKRQTGLKNKEFPLSIVLVGASQDTDLTALETAMVDNEFFYFDTEGHQSRLDGVYAITGRFIQRKDRKDAVIYVNVRIVEKES